MIFQCYNETITLNNNSNNNNNNNNNEIMVQFYVTMEVASSGGYQYTLKQ